MIELKLFFVFSRIGLLGFGGGLAMLPMIYQGASGFGLIDKGEFADLVGISQITPGPLAINAATYVGYNAEGVLGAALATFAVALPSFILVMVICAVIDRFRSSAIVEGAFTGIRPVTVGLLASASVFVGKEALIVASAINPFAAIICILSVILMFTRKISPVAVIIMAGVAGAVVLS